MRTLYVFLLRLYPAHVRREFGDEMMAVFDEARALQRQAGSAAYFWFCLREAAGLLSNLPRQEILMRHGRSMVQGAIAGCIIAAAFAAARAAQPYTSSVRLRLMPSQIPERFVPAQAAGSLIATVPNLMEPVLSRGALTNIVNTYGLYPSQRERKPMEDVIDDFRRAIQIGLYSDDLYQISFAYQDRILAQKVAAELAGRVVAEFTRSRQVQSELTLRFMEDESRRAADAWEKAAKAVRANNLDERARLDAEIARQRYESVSAKLSEAGTLRELERRMQGPALEIVDPPNFPADTRPSVWAWAAGGLAGGTGLGLIVSVMAAAVHRRRAAAVEA